MWPPRAGHSSHVPAIRWHCTRVAHPSLPATLAGVGSRLLRASGAAHLVRTHATHASVLPNKLHACVALARAPVSAVLPLSCAVAGALCCDRCVARIEWTCSARGCRITGSFVFFPGGMGIR